MEEDYRRVEQNSKKEKDLDERDGEGTMQLERS
jgi:hypothetical protein